MLPLPTMRSQSSWKPLRTACTRYAEVSDMLTVKPHKPLYDRKAKKGIDGLKPFGVHEAVESGRMFLHAFSDLFGFRHAGRGGGEVCGRVLFAGFKTGNDKRTAEDARQHSPQEEPQSRNAVSFPRQCREGLRCFLFLRGGCPEQFSACASVSAGTASVETSSSASSMPLSDPWSMGWNSLTSSLPPLCWSAPTRRARRPARPRCVQCLCRRRAPPGSREWPRA